MSVFVSQENNRINYKHATYNRIMSEISDWQQYLQQTWKYFENEKTNFLSWIEQNPIKEDDPKDSTWKRSLEHNIFYRYPHKHLSSIFVKLYIIAESELGSFCDFYQKHFEIELSGKDEKKIKVNQDNYYWLKRLLLAKELIISELDAEYNRLLQYKKIRDNLSHQKEHTLISNTKDDTFREFLNKSEGLTITESYWVQEGMFHVFYIHSDELIKSVIKTIDEFFKTLLDMTYLSEKNKLKK